MENKKVAVVTGAANGIGKAAALQFAGSGYAVALADISADGLELLRPELEAQQADFLLIPGDLQEQSCIGEITGKTLSRWGRIDVLINNAAWRTIATMRNITVDQWNKTIAICLTAPAFLAKAAAAAMEKNGLPGVIINISSVMSQRAGGTSPAYIACKGALESLTYELATLYGPKNIRVISINPGNIRTAISGDYTDGQGKNISDQLSDHVSDLTALRRAGTPDEVAKVCVWLSGDDASFITGSVITVDGGFQHNFNSYQFKTLQFPKEF